MQRSKFEGSRAGNIPQNNSFARDIYRAFTAELGAMTAYVQGAVTLAQHLPSVTRLFDEIARVEISHYEQLGQLLLHLGIAPALNVRLRNDPVYLEDHSTVAASLFATQMIKEKIREEESAAREYRRLAATAPSDAIKDMLEAIAAEEEDHAIALASMKKRFEGS